MGQEKKSKCVNLFVGPIHKKAQSRWFQFQLASKAKCTLHSIVKRLLLISGQLHAGKILACQNCWLLLRMVEMRKI